MTVDRTTIIERIRKLSRMTQANGAAESEALQAASLMARLIAEHHIADTELSLKRDAAGCIADAFVACGQRRSTRPQWLKVAHSIERLFNLKGFIRYSEEDLYGLGIPTPTIERKFYGFPEDVTAAVVLLTICHNAIISASETQPKRQQESFEAGMCDRLCQRIDALREAKPSPSGNALIVLKDQLVSQEFAEYLRKLGVQLHVGSSGYGNAHNPAAYARGQGAGSNVDIGQQGKLYGTRQLTSR